jgi:hypothetical protein
LSKNTDNILVEDHLPLPLLVPNDLRGLVRGEVLLALYSRLSFSSNLEEWETRLHRHLWHWCWWCGWLWPGTTVEIVVGGVWSRQGRRESRVNCWSSWAAFRTWRLNRWWFCEPCGLSRPLESFGWGYWGSVLVVVLIGFGMMSCCSHV